MDINFVQLTSVLAICFTAIVVAWIYRPDRTQNPGVSEDQIAKIRESRFHAKKQIAKAEASTWSSTALPDGIDPRLRALEDSLLALNEKAAAWDKTTREHKAGLVGG